MFKKIVKGIGKGLKWVGANPSNLIQLITAAKMIKGKK